MKKEAKNDLAQKSLDELQAEVLQLRDQLLQGRIKQAAENQQQGMTARVARRQIARLLTYINQKRTAEVQA